MSRVLRINLTIPRPHHCLTLIRIVGFSDTFVYTSSYNTGSVPPRSIKLCTWLLAVPCDRILPCLGHWTLFGGIWRVCSVLRQIHACSVIYCRICWWFQCVCCCSQTTIGMVMESLEKTSIRIKFSSGTSYNCFLGLTLLTGFGGGVWFQGSLHALWWQTNREAMKYPPRAAAGDHPGFLIHPPGHCTRYRCQSVNTVTISFYL